MSGIRECPAPAWKPIATAPKDGTTILLWGPYCTHPSPCEFQKGDWFVVVDGYRAVEYMGGFGTEYHTFQVPTHWMPLPAPPVTE